MKNAEDPLRFRTICDLSKVSTALQMKTYKDIVNDLTEIEKAQTDFLFN